MVKKHEHENVNFIVTILSLGLIFSIAVCIYNNVQLHELQGQLENKADRICHNETIEEKLTINPLNPWQYYRPAKDQLLLSNHLQYQKKELCISS